MRVDFGAIDVTPLLKTVSLVEVVGSLLPVLDVHELLALLDQLLDQLLLVVHLVEELGCTDEVVYLFL